MSKQYIASLSYGKDSMAMLHVIRDVLDLPLDRIITADVWATDTIPADLPPMVEFKKYADEEIKRRWGIDVEHFKAPTTYERLFYRVKSENAKHPSTIYGFPMMQYTWCNWKLKQPPLRAIEQETVGAISYIGIAMDEPERLIKLTTNQKAPLAEAKWTENDCMKWCTENDLLSPTYKYSSRDGCWFCHKQRTNALRNLRKYYPELWEILLKWDTDSPGTFHADGKTVHDFDRRFQWEDEGYLPRGKQFRWEDTKYAQMNIFQFLGGRNEEDRDDA